MLDGLFYSHAAGSLRSSHVARQAREVAGQASRSAREARAEGDALASDVERLFMITEALWDLLKKEHGYTDEELRRRVEDIDLRDGTLNGRVAPDGVLKCPDCGRTLMGKHPFCLYCGAPVALDPFDR